MALTINPSPENRMSDAELAEWRDIPVAVIGDELNRSCVMHADINPLRDGYRVAAQALTIECMVGDNAALHYGVPEAWPGCAMVVDAQGFVDTALWGEILNTAAEAQGVAAFIIDGAVRDSAELRKSPIAVYARGICPAGPHKGFGGSVNASIQCAGVAVSPGDLIVGDDDGIVVIRPDQMDGLADRCRARIASEVDKLAKIRDGVTTPELLNLPSLEDYKKA